MSDGGNRGASIGTLRIRMTGGSRADGVRLAQDVAMRLAEAGSEGWGTRGTLTVRVPAPRRGAPAAGTIADAVQVALKRQGGGGDA